MKATSLLLLVMLLVHKAACQFYYVLPSEEHDCPGAGEICGTLSLLAANSSEYFTESSVIVFAPGKHKLNTTLTLSNINNVTIMSNVTSATIECTEGGHLSLRSIESVVISGLDFSGCQENIIQSVESCVLENCQFETHNASRTVLNIIDSSLAICDTMFIAALTQQIDTNSVMVELFLLSLAT